MRAQDDWALRRPHGADSRALEHHAYAELLPDETAASAVAFLERTLTWLAGLGVRVERVMTYNAFCYTQRQYTTALARLGLRHLRTRPYTPRTNGKAERFIQTALRERGLRPDLPLVRASRCRPSVLPHILQHRATPYRARPATALQSPLITVNNLSGSDS